jgi:hypothetical protein
VEFVKSEVKTEFDIRTTILATKKNDLHAAKGELMKAIYLVTLSQFIALMIGVIAVMNFMKISAMAYIALTFSRGFFDTQGD